MNKIFVITSELNEKKLKDLEHSNILFITKKNIDKDLSVHKIIDILYYYGKINPFLYLKYYLMVNNISGIIDIYALDKIDDNIIELKKFIEQKNTKDFEKCNNISKLRIDTNKLNNINLSKSITQTIEKTLQKIYIVSQTIKLNNNIKIEYNKFLNFFLKENENILLIGNNNIQQDLSKLIDNFFTIRFNINIPTKYNNDKNRGTKTDMIFMGDPVKNYFFKNKNKKNKIKNYFKEEQLNEVSQLLKQNKKCIFRSSINLYPFFINKNKYIINNFKLRPVILDNIIISIASQKWNMGDSFISMYNNNNKHLTSGLFMIFFLLSIGIKPHICGFCNVNDKYYNVNYNKLVKEQLNKKYTNIKNLNHHDVKLERLLIKIFLELNLIKKID